LLTGGVKPHLELTVRAQDRKKLKMAEKKNPGTGEGVEKKWQRKEGKSKKVCYFASWSNRAPRQVRTGGSETSKEEKQVGRGGAKGKKPVKESRTGSSPGSLWGVLPQRPKHTRRHNVGPNIIVKEVCGGQATVEVTKLNDGNALTFSTCEVDARHRRKKPWEKRQKTPPSEWGGPATPPGTHRWCPRQTLLGGHVRKVN